jgi:methylphosphotriester-DNA--protein-cysteine methyltransferase
VFREWAFTFLDDFERAHRILSPDELIELLARESRHSLHVSGLARRLGMHPVRLRRLCRELLGMSPRAYCQRTRVWQALKHLADSHEKVDAVALEFGWRSKKNFYRAVRAVTGLTPRQVRLREFSKTDGAREGDRTRHVP